MDQLTVTEAIEHGYEYYLYVGEDWQGLKEISDLTDDEFKKELVLADKQPSYPWVPSNEEILELLADHIIVNYRDSVSSEADAGDIEEEVKKIDLGDLSEKLAQAASICSYRLSAKIKLIKG